MTYLLIFIIVILVLVILAQKSKSAKVSQDVTPSTISEPVVTLEVQVTSDFQEVNKDAWEEWDVAHYGPGQRLRKLDGARLHIHFTDREGKQTQRDITTRKYSYNPETKVGVVYAHCHLRNGNRPFAMQRITYAMDLETGEIVQRIGDHLDAIYEQTPLFAVEQFLKQHDAGAYLLFSLAKADGVMRGKERAIILDWAKSLGLTDQPALNELEAQMRGDWYMTKHSYWDAVKSVKKIPRTDAYMKALWAAAVAVVQSDKRMGDQELSFLRYAAKQWGIPNSEMPALPPLSK